MLYTRQQPDQPLIAMGKNKKVDENLVRSIHEKIFHFLNESGERFSSTKNMLLTLKPAPFEGWAIEHAEFLRKAIHHDDEIAMAFFPQIDIKPQFDQSAPDEMFAISLEELKVDIPVEFNLYLYLYLPANQKYILYTPRGAVLYSKQMDKLTRQGVT